jgi:3-methyladenine DNA glycosylase AlkD
MTVAEVLHDLRQQTNPANQAGMARFGIDTSTALGISIPWLRAYARPLGKNHDLALALWETNVHEGRILATIIDDPAKVTYEQADHWVSQLNSWDICDQLCHNLLSYTPFALELVERYGRQEPEFVRRAGFALLASLCHRPKIASDQVLRDFFPLIESMAGDGRNFVKKAVNWALREIGKRNQSLGTDALVVAERIAAQGTPSARWIARDAIRELRSARYRHE